MLYGIVFWYTMFALINWALMGSTDCQHMADGGVGEALLPASCENHKCPDRFKCPGFYCISWRLVCNGQWECPGGTDEMSCEEGACPGLFKCRDSKICISRLNLCDNVADCHLHDDEYFCQMSRIPHLCPISTSCWA